MSLEIVILAAGQGKRMHSDLPKVLHPIGGKPMLVHIIETAIALKPSQIHIICGVHTDSIQPQVNQYIHIPLHWIYQEKPLGTGHAVQCALPFLNPMSQVLVLFGDCPLISVNTLQILQQKTATQSLGLLLVNLQNPFGFGRIVRNQSGHIQAIIEEKDANASQKMIQEIFTGILLSTTAALARWLPQLQSNNAQGEYYLTDIIHMAAQEANHYGQPIVSTHAAHRYEVKGVNDRLQLIALERIYQSLLAKKLLLSGVNILDPKRFDVRGTLQCGQDTTIDVNVVFEGDNLLGKHCYIGPNCVIRNSCLSDNVIVQANSVLDGVTAASGVQIGPFARLRPETVLAQNTKVGNFVEMKKTHLGADSKVNHLSYIGDATIGEDVNIGAGTITCNYDGVNKHRTIIDDGAFIGSDTQLVAPVHVGKNATIGAGSTIRKDVPAGQLILMENIRQKTVPGWQRPVKAKIVKTES